MPSAVSPRPSSTQTYVRSVAGNGLRPPSGPTACQCCGPEAGIMLPSNSNSPLRQQQQQQQRSQQYLPPPAGHHHQQHSNGHHHHSHQQHHHHHHQRASATSSPAPRPLSPPTSATTSAIPRPPPLSTSAHQHAKQDHHYHHQQQQQQQQQQSVSLPQSPAPTPVTAPVSAVTASPASASPSSAFSSIPGPGFAAAPPAAQRPAGIKRPAAAELQRSVSTAPPVKRPATTSTTAPTVGSVKRSGSPSPTPASFHDHIRQAPSSVPSAMSVSTTTTTIPVLPVPSAAMMHQPLTADQLHGKSPEQLIHAVLQLQSQHHQYVAHISSQYQNISQQLAELRSSLHAFYSGQAASHQAAASAISPSSALTTSTMRDPFSGSSRQTTVPPMVPQHQQPPQPPLPGHFHRPSTSHSRQGSQRLPPLSPTNEAGVLPRPMGQTPATPSGPPVYEYRTVATVEEVWREYKEGIDGQPAIEELDASWGSRWRPEPRGRTWYSRRKVIWDKIKDYMSEGMDEASAVQEVERLRDGGTINKLIRLLQDERKEDRGLDDSMLI